MYRLIYEIASKVYLVPLFGHTAGHCGVAISVGERWLFHIGDAYYLRIELTTDEHPVSELAKQASEDNELRMASLRSLQYLVREYDSEVEMFGYHDFDELSAEPKAEQGCGLPRVSYI